MRKKREFEDDDGRAIVDMRGVEKMPLFGSLVPPSRRELEKPAEKKEPWRDEYRMSNGEKFWYILGSLKAALLIASAYIIGLGAIILLMILVFSLT